MSIEYNAACKQLEANRSAEELLSLLCRLHQIKDATLVEFYCFAVRVEATCLETITDAGYTTFEQFLIQNKLSSGTLYRCFADGLALLPKGESTAMRIGFLATVMMQRLSSETARLTFINDVVAFTNEHEHLPSQRELTKLAIAADSGFERLPRLSRNDEVAHLRQRVVELEVENKMLRQEVRKLERRVSVAKRSAQVSV